MITYAALGAVAVIGLLSLFLWICHIDGKAKETEIAKLTLRLEDAGSKIKQQNAAVDQMAQDRELARAERDKAIADAKEQIAKLGSRARDIRTILVQSPSLPPKDRTAEKAVQEVRKKLLVP